MVSKMGAEHDVNSQMAPVGFPLFEWPSGYKSIPTWAKIYGNSGFDDHKVGGFLSELPLVFP